MSIPDRISLVTVGVRDVAATTAFYRALGWELSFSSVPGEVSFFRTAGALLALWGVDNLADDARVPPTSTRGFRGVALAINVESREAVDDALETARGAGGSICKPAQETEWGGYSGYFADPEGNLWEVAHNPFWPLDDRGLPELP